MNSQTDQPSATRSARRSKPPILVVAPFFPPALAGGGPVVSLAETARLLSNMTRVLVVTRGWDAGSRSGLAEVSTGRWCRRQGVCVIYLSRWQSWWLPVLLVRRFPEAIVYLNSLFDVRLSLLPLLVRRLVHRRMRVVMAPRGELQSGALRIRPWRKRLYLFATRTAKLFEGVRWQAATVAEERDVRCLQGAAVDVRVVPNLRPAAVGVAARVREGRGNGPLRLVYFSRIVPIKNLAFLLDALVTVRAAVRLSIAGPPEDSRYWEGCRRRIEVLPANVSVVVTGAVARADVPAFLARHDLFVLPTLGESFGHAILDALDAGVPVLISRATPWRDLEARRAGMDLPLDLAAFGHAVERFASMSDEEMSSWREGACRAGREFAGGPAAEAATTALFGGDWPGERS